MNANIKQSSFYSNFIRKTEHMLINGTETCASFKYEVSAFDLLTEQEKRLINSTSLIVNYKKGENVCKQGSFASHIMYIEKGLCKTYLEGQPKNLILTITPQDNFLGIQSLYEGNNKFLYSVSTYTDAIVKMIETKVFKQLLMQNPSFSYRVMNILNENTAISYGHFFSITQKQGAGRLADMLLCLSKKIFKSDSFELPLSRSDLSDLTCMSTESVIRIMKDFKDNQIIETSNKHISIIDIPRLERISDKG
jgi:CRP/FNR family transcriptional regulator, polysaccharide utilization system transcription regulator